MIYMKVFVPKTKGIEVDPTLSFVLSTIFHKMLSKLTVMSKDLVGTLCSLSLALNGSTSLLWRYCQATVWIPYILKKLHLEDLNKFRTEGCWPENIVQILPPSTYLFQYIVSKYPTQSTGDQYKQSYNIIRHDQNNILNSIYKIIVIKQYYTMVVVIDGRY